MNDPAFLFYSSDFLTGTMLFTDEQVGKYIRTLCYIHQHGHIDIEELKLLCKEDKLVMSKFIQDNDNKYYNNRLEFEIEKRKLYSNSRRNNRLKKDMNNICKSYDQHMENENEIVNDNIIINNNNIYFDNFWKAYPKKQGKGNVEKWFNKNKPTKELVDIMIKQVERFKDTKDWKKKDGQFIPYPYSWLNAKMWEDEFETETEEEERIMSE